MHEPSPNVLYLIKGANLHFCVLQGFCRGTHIHPLCMSFISRYDHNPIRGFSPDQSINSLLLSNETQADPITAAIGYCQ